MEKVKKISATRKGDILSPFNYIKRIFEFRNVLPFLANISGILVALIILGFLFTLGAKSLEFAKNAGVANILRTTWNPIAEEFGGLPFIVTTVLVSIIALGISVPFTLSVSIFIAEWKRKNMFFDVFNTALDLLSAIPSVVYGFWALFVLTPIIRILQLKLGYPPYGVGVLTAALVLAIMIIPFSVGISREVLKLVSSDIKEAGFSLGATEFEVTRVVTLPLAKQGIIAGFILALGRALGETMAVTMVIGNFNAFPKNLFSPSNTIASLIANQFNEAWGNHQSALIFLGFLLFLITLIINLLGGVILRGAKHEL